MVQLVPCHLHCHHSRVRASLSQPIEGGEAFLRRIMWPSVTISPVRRNVHGAAEIVPIEARVALTLAARPTAVDGDQIVLGVSTRFISRCAFIIACQTTVFDWYGPKIFLRVKYTFVSDTALHSILLFREDDGVWAVGAIFSQPQAVLEGRLRVVARNMVPVDVFSGDALGEVLHPLAPLGVQLRVVVGLVKPRQVSLGHTVLDCTARPGCRKNTFWVK